MATGAQQEPPRDWAGDAQNASTDGAFKRDILGGGTGPA